MSEILQIKDWLINKNKQFEIIQESILGIYKIIRIKDQHCFTLGENVAYIGKKDITISSIAFFSNNCINVRMFNGEILDINSINKHEGVPSGMGWVVEPITVEERRNHLK